MLRTSIFTALLVVSSVAHAASECKGLDATTCASNPICQWVPERIKGETKTFDGKPHKRSAKAHCRKETIASRATKDTSAPVTDEAPKPAPAQ